MTKANHLSKFISLVMAFVLATCMVPLAYADNENTQTTTTKQTKGSIIIDNPVVGARYDLYKIFDVTHNTDDDTGKYAYTINGGDSGTGRWLDFFFEMDNGEVQSVKTSAEKYIHKYNSETDIENPGQTIYYLTYKDESYVLNLNDTNITEFSADALKFALENFDKPYKTITAQTSAQLTIDNIELGYYLVYPYGQSRYINNGASVCSLVTNAPTKTISIKSTWPSITKKITSVNGVSGKGDGTVAVGEEVEFTIECKIPDPTGYDDGYLLNIYDTMLDGLAYKAGSLTIEKADGSSFSSSDYSSFFKLTENTEMPTGFKLEIHPSVIQKNSTALIGTKINIKYKAKVTQAAVISGAYNSAYVEYSNDPNDSTKTGTSTPQEIKVYSNTINVVKYDRDGEDNLVLDGAEFYLYKLGSDSKKLYYKVDEDGIVSWVSDMTKATKRVTDTKGTVTFEGIDSGDYYLWESQPPSGYNALTKPIYITISSSSDDYGSLATGDGSSTPTAPEVVAYDLPGMGDKPIEVKASDDENANTFTYTVSVGNSGGKVLPSTGGAGAFVIYGVSAAALVAAIVLLIRKNRKRKQTLQL